MMARNKVQFQKGLSEAQFAVLYGTEDRCRDAVMRWRWPSGFVCPVCGGKRHSVVKTRALYQCTACRRQTSDAPGVADPCETAQAVTDNGAGGIEIARRQGGDLGAAEAHDPAQLQAAWLAL